MRCQASGSVNPSSEMASLRMSTEHSVNPSLESQLTTHTRIMAAASVDHMRCKARTLLWKCSYVRRPDMHSSECVSGLRSFTARGLQEVANVHQLSSVHKTSEMDVVLTSLGPKDKNMYVPNTHKPIASSWLTQKTETRPDSSTFQQKCCNTETAKSRGPEPPRVIHTR